MKIICFSDTHGLHRALQVPDGDILLFAGDMTAMGTKEEIVDFNKWLGTLMHPNKIIIAGNHDLFFENNPIEARKLITNAIYLENELIEIEGLRIYGTPISPFSPNFGSDWAFNIQRGNKIQQFWNKIPEDVDILISHCPPKNILDKNLLFHHEGCGNLRNEIRDRIRPKIHLFGHIHESYGTQIINNTTYINASIVAFKSKINSNILLKWTWIIAVICFQKLKIILKFLGVNFIPKHSKSVKYFWEIKNKALIIDL